MSEAIRHLWWRLTAHSDYSEVMAYPPSWLFYTSNVLEDLIFNFQGTLKRFPPSGGEPLHLLPLRSAFRTPKIKKYFQKNKKDTSFIASCVFLFFTLINSYSSETANILLNFLIFSNIMFPILSSLAVLSKNI